MAIRKLPIGIQSFEKLRQGGYLYVDKTPYIWKMIQDGSVYFLSRPRRFGKSLLVSTLEAYFHGQKELFQGLAIERLENANGENAWTSYPVIKFSLSGGSYQEEEGLSDTLRVTLQSVIMRYSLQDIAGETLPMLFKLVIEGLYKKTGQQVVVLVDEYDKPLLETMIVNEEQEEKNRQLYKSFFSVLKDEDQYLKFVFFTGVTKFSKVSIFSDLNQLNDISLDNRYAGICGITQEELSGQFGPEIQAMAQKQGMTEEETLSELARMYDGYHFSPEGEGVYNPFSLLNAFDKKDFGSYWFETGTPTFLIRKLRASSFTPEEFTDGIEAQESDLLSYRAESPNPIPLFYQSGYLTIAGFDREFRLYHLCFPNAEVKYGFLYSLVPSVLGDEGASGPLTARNMVLDLRRGNIDSLLTRLQALFAAIPYPEGAGHAYESEWRNEIFLIFTLLGQYVQCEIHTAAGRADCTVKTKDYIYLFEFKVDKPASEGLQQIEDKGYALPYASDPRKLYKIGVSFSSEKRVLTEWEIA